MVVATIDKFVDVQPVTGMGRLRTAFEEVKSGLSVEDGRRHKAHGLAYRKVRDAIEATKGFVGTGGIFNMSAEDHNGLDLSAFKMLEVKDGKWTLVE